VDKIYKVKREILIYKRTPICENKIKRKLRIIILEEKYYSMLNYVMKNKSHQKLRKIN
jgi:hypothetical protein